MRIKTLRSEMILNAHGYNKHLSKTVFNKMTDMELLAFCHPLDRDEFKRKILKQYNNGDNSTTEN